MSEKNLNSIELFKPSDGPLFISWDITQKCNLECIHCFNDSSVYRDNELSYNETINLAQQIADLKPETVCLCGGEPLMNEYVLEIIDILVPKSNKVNMVTNGWFMNLELARKLKRAGLSHIQISLDGSNPTLHDNFRKKVGSFNKAIQAIKYCVEAGLSVGVAMSLSKINYKNIEQVAEIAYELGTDQFRSMPLLPLGRAKDDYLHLMLSSNELFYVGTTFDKLASKYEDSSFVTEWGDPLDHLTRMQTNCYYGLNTIAIDIKTDGDVVISTYLPYKIGNIKKDKLKDIWLNSRDAWRNPKLLNDIDLIKNIYDLSICDIDTRFENRKELY